METPARIQLPDSLQKQLIEIADKQLSMFEKQTQPRKSATLIWDEVKQKYVLSYNLNYTIPGRVKVFEGTVSAGTPVILEVQRYLGRAGFDGEIINDAAQTDLRIYLSDDGENYNGGKEKDSTEYLTRKAGEVFLLIGRTVELIKLVSPAGDVDYRVWVA